MAAQDQLAIPDNAARDAQSFEVMRVWVASSGQLVTLRSGVWEDPAAWGMMLADLARHVVNTYQPASATERDQILNRIKLGFDVEMQSPTDAPSGAVDIVT